MNVVRHAADAIRLAAGVARDGREIRVEFGPRVGIEVGLTIFRGKDDVEDDEAQGLRHGDGAGFQPFDGLCSVTWGVAPGWDGGAPLALSESPFQTASIVD